MKTSPHKAVLLLVLCLSLSGIFSRANAQSKTIFYWSFDNFNSGLSVQGDPSLMKPIYATWSSTDTSKGYISDLIVPGTSKYYQAYWDNYPVAEASDTFNVQHGGLSGTAAGNLSLRLRNPNDSMMMTINAPTTHYKNIAIKFDVFKSGSGPVKDLFDYSTDGGKTWVTTGLSMPSDSPNATSWIPVTVKISNTAAENNSGFIFRLKTTPPNAILNGNDRFDNFSVAGDSIGGSTPPPPGQKVMYYWHFDNFVGQTAAGSPSLIPTIHSNWSTLDSSKGILSYIPSYVVSSKYATFWDVVAGEASDTFNVKKGGKSGLATGNNELRFRNPSDSMEALITVPTTRYKNITIKYGLERTSSGQGSENFDYSTDGGTSWKTTGLSIKHDTALTVFSLVTVNLSTDTTVNNNANGFIFRIKFNKPNSSTSGNDRIDNLTIEGDTDKIFSTPPPPTQKVIYYWHFDNFVGQTVAGSPSLIPTIHSNWSTLDSTKGIISYVPAYTVSSKYQTYWDVVAGEASDTFNVKKGGKSGTTAGNNELRFRNPSDSMEALITVPTSHYKNITIKYDLERTSSGQGSENFDYSTDGGTTWKTSGLSIKHDTALTVFSLVTVRLSTDTTVNNNATGFIFRIRFNQPNSATNGNDRIDNLTVEGDTDKAVHVHNSGIAEKEVSIESMTLYPNPAQTQVTISSGSDNAKTISILDMNGRVVYTTTSSDSNVLLGISNLKSGIYIVNVIENQTGKSAYLRLIKN